MIGISAAVHLPLGPLDEVATPAALALNPVRVGAAIGRQDEAVRIGVDDGVDVIAPAIALAGVRRLRRLVAVEGHQRDAEPVHHRQRRLEMAFAVRAPQARFQVDQGDDPFVEEALDAVMPFTLQGRAVVL
jgi:hypothetical protein